MADNLRFIQLLDVLEHDDRAHHLDPLGIGNADDRYLGDLGQLVDLLQLAAGDVFATAFDHVLLAVDDGDVAILFAGRQITAVEPAALEGFGGALRVVEVAAELLR